MKLTICFFHTFVLFVAVFVLLGVACSSPVTSSGETPPLSSQACSDGDCPLGEECEGDACAPVRPTLYPHIQLATALLRHYLEYSEVLWRANHSDLLIGHTAKYADQLRAENPNARLFEYTTFRYYRYPDDAEAWAAENGYSTEDFYLHYRQDVNVPGYESVVLVPGSPPGFVPGWNPNRLPGEPPASAVEGSQARVFGIRELGHEPWQLANICNEGYRKFLIDLMAKHADGTRSGDPIISGPVEGIMVDHGVFYPQFNEGLLEKTNEFYQLPLDESHAYAIGFEAFYTELLNGLMTRLGKNIDILPNYGHAQILTWTDRFSKNIQDITDWAWGEAWITYMGYSHPTTGPNRAITYEVDYEHGIADMARQAVAGGRRVLGARDLALSPNGSDRGRLYTLALYYLIHNPNTFYLYQSFRGHNCQEHISEWQWNPAVEYDIGQPAPIPDGTTDFDGNAGTTEHFEFAVGEDPYDPSLTYHVLARRFTRGLVVVKMLPLGSVVDERSATVHQLDRSYTVLEADGTTSQEPVTEISIRNNEGIILVIP
ncbi:MAG: hypothetical protein JSW58_15770 [Candidatus Latescibacterota bacterium]|nr:MAG: hypothetical protein JSW58_15770 [Candidatus Latescibacterota bacterium]